MTASSSRSLFKNRSAEVLEEGSYAAVPNDGLVSRKSEDALEVVDKQEYCLRPRVVSRLMLSCASCTSCVIAKCRMPSCCESGALQPLNM